ncbi:hypothetical protein KUTeg_016621 [Tegillarca granosa]|uniref:Uncharacterized protein n=1 Tax=Tegillarca granosa TaxID=220873 RepID=A0ABQ9ENX8_TEGGR|nr:hypothetical protein KUTeg_016621 [Tegillarca granosa]
MATNITSSISEIKIDSKSKQHCCVPLCTSDARYNPNLNVHHIPKDPDVRKTVDNKDKKR